MIFKQYKTFYFIHFLYFWKTKHSDWKDFICLLLFCAARTIRCGSTSGTWSPGWTSATSPMKAMTCAGIITPSSAASTTRCTSPTAPAATAGRGRSPTRGRRRSWRPSARESVTSEDGGSGGGRGKGVNAAMCGEKKENTLKKSR